MSLATATVSAIGAGLLAAWCLLVLFGRAASAWLRRKRLIGLLILPMIAGGCAMGEVGGIKYSSFLKDISAKARITKTDGTIIDIDVTSNVNEGMMRGLAEGAVQGAIRGARP